MNRSEVAWCKARVSITIPTSPGESFCNRLTQATGVVKKFYVIFMVMTIALAFVC